MSKALPDRILARERRIRKLVDELERVRKNVAVSRAEAQELDAEIESLERRIESEQRTPLILRLGRWQFRRNIGAQDVAKFFIAFHLAAVTAGAILIFQPSPLKELGTALVVGGLFAFGTLLSAIWSAIYDDERALNKIVDERQSAAAVDLEHLARLIARELDENKTNLTPFQPQGDDGENGVPLIPMRLDAAPSDPRG